MPNVRKLFQSFQFQLMFWAVLSLLLLALIAGGYSFWYSYHEMNEFQDDSLKNTAALLEQSLNISSSATAPLEGFDSQTHIHFDADDDDKATAVDIIFLPLAFDTTPLSHQRDNKHADSKPIPLELLDNIPLGISDQKINKHDWRTYRNDVKIKSLNPNGKIAIILRQQTELRDDLAQTSALQSSLPLLIGISFLVLLLPFIMWRMMKPVRQLRHEIANRNESDLSPLAIDKLPLELLPLAQALNKLLALVKMNIDQQQRFIADAAHELRSPLTALSLHLQRLQRMTNDSAMSEGLDKLAVRLKRNQSLVEQLLTLVRAGNIATVIETNAPISVKAIIEQVIGLIIPIADYKNIELTVDLRSDRHINMDETSLLILIKNLMQNAILYTPAKGQVAVKLYELEEQLILSEAIKHFGSQVIGSENGKSLLKNQTLNPKLVLQIIDSGIGISASDYKHAFEPFIRLNEGTNAAANNNENTSNLRSDSAHNTSQSTQGTGLGLSIVKTICEQSNIAVFMNDSKLQTKKQSSYRGLCVTLVFSI